MNQNSIILLFLLLVFAFIAFIAIPLLMKLAMVTLVGYLLYDAFIMNAHPYADTVVTAENNVRDLKSIRADKVDTFMLGPEFLRHEDIGADDLNFNSVDLTPFDIENFADPLEVSEQVKNIVDFEDQPYELVPQFLHSEEIFYKHDTEPHDIDEALAYKQRHRGEKNMLALNGIASAQRNVFDRYLRGELDENEARVWWAAEADASNDLY
jgi:hypothetical protein